MTKELCKPFGELVSICARTDRKERVFAFVCFTTHKEAEEALKALHGADVFNRGEGLYVAFSQKRSTRVKLLERQY